MSASGLAPPCQQSRDDHEKNVLASGEMSIDDGPLHRPRTKARLRHGTLPTEERDANVSPPGWAQTPGLTCLIGGILVCLTVPGLRPRRRRAIPHRIVSSRSSSVWRETQRDENVPGRPVISIRLATTRVSDDQLGGLRSLSSLRSLDLAQTRISDAGLARLRGHDGLRNLVLVDTRVSESRSRVGAATTAARPPENRNPKKWDWPGGFNAQE